MRKELQVGDTWYSWVVDLEYEDKEYAVFFREDDFQIRRINDEGDLVDEELPREIDAQLSLIAFALMQEDRRGVA